MSSQKPIEYTMLIKKLKKSIEAELKDYVTGVVLYGSMVEGTIIGGESDCDIAFILKSLNSADEGKEMVEKIEKTLNPYMMDPIFSTLLDVMIIPYEAIPNGVNAVLKKLLKKGDVLFGSNPFKDLEVEEEELKNDAFKMALNYYQNISRYALDTSVVDFQEEEMVFEQAFMAIDAILGCSQAFLFYNGEEGFSKNDAPDIIEAKYADVINPLVPREAQAIRLGSSGDRTQLLDLALGYCLQVISVMSGKNISLKNVNLGRKFDETTSGSMIEETAELEKKPAKKTKASSKTKTKKIPLTKIKNMGPKTRKLIRDQLGINSVNELAEKDPAEIANIKGISKKRAEEWISEAKKLLEEQ